MPSRQINQLFDNSYFGLVLNGILLCTSVFLGLIVKICDGTHGGRSYFYNKFTKLCHRPISVNLTKIDDENNNAIFSYHKAILVETGLFWITFRMSARRNLRNSWICWGWCANCDVQFACWLMRHFQSFDSWLIVFVDYSTFKIYATFLLKNWFT